VTAAAPPDAQARARQLTLGELLRRQAHRSPDAPALCLDDRTLTYGRLNALADRLAAALAAHEVGTGDTVGVFMHNSLEMVQTLFAIHKLGAVAVPVNIRLTGPEVAFILDDAGVVGLVADEPLLAPVRGDLTVGWELAVGGDSYERAITDAGQPPGALVDADAAAFIMYTSGTTGRPKGAVLTHTNLAANNFNWAFAVGINYGDVYSAGFPLFHIGGLVGLYPFLMLGNRVVLQHTGGFDPEVAVHVMATAPSTVCAYVPAQWQLIAGLPSVAAALRGQRRALWGGSPASRPLLERMTEVLPVDSVVATFGQTEVTANATFSDPRDSRRALGSVGRPAMTMEHRILDDDGEDVASGDVGEIVYRGPTVTSGYWRRPEATAEAFRGGWFHSGDMVRTDADGLIYVVDRKSDMIISGGENIYPAELERVLIEHPAVNEVAVVGEADARWGERPVAYVVLVPGTAPDRAELIGFCAPRLASFKHPSRIVAVDQLPRNAAGKVLKGLLRERASPTWREEDR
jgi:fatty-acyl-CoA synthase